MVAVSQAGEALQFASDRLKGDKEIVLRAVTKDGSMLKYASTELRQDFDTVLAAVKSNGVALKYGSKALQNDKEVVRVAVENRGEALEFASKALRSDKEIVGSAIKAEKNSYLLRYASEALMKDEDFLLNLFDEVPSVVEHFSAVFTLKAVQRDWKACQKLLSARDIANNTDWSFSTRTSILVEIAKHDLGFIKDVPKNSKVHRETLEEVSKQLQASVRKLNRKNVQQERQLSILQHESDELKNAFILKETVEKQIKKIKELESALASSTPIERIDLTQDEGSEDSRPSKRARLDGGSDNPKSSLAILHEKSMEMVQVKKEAIEKADAAEKEKEAALLKLECPICACIQEQTVAFIPCGHVMCAGCAGRCDTCPTCRGDIEGRLRLYK